ncbi:MAG: PIN domain-containing protein, partial [Thermoplasmata archaeon]
PPGRESVILETSFVVDLLRGDPRAEAKARDLDAREETVYLAAPTLFELWEGVSRGLPGRREHDAVQAFVDAHDLLPFGPTDAREAGLLSGRLKRRGRAMGTVDVQLAGMAKARGETLLTGDRDFSAVAEVVGLEGYR